jgi:hypothetical protein
MIGRDQGGVARAAAAEHGDAKHVPIISGPMKEAQIESNPFDDLQEQFRHNRGSRIRFE